MKIALVDKTVGFIIKTRLKSLGFEVVPLPESKNITDSVATHPDIAIFKHDNTVIVNKEYAEADARHVFNRLKRLNGRINIIKSDEVPKSPYPQDTIYNALVIGKKLFARAKSVSHDVLSYAKERGLKIVEVNQGYPACTVLKLTDSAAITADKGMAKALQAEGIEVTLINGDGILLPPYDCGFIGGAATSYDGCVYFLGNPRWHPSYKDIMNAIKRSGLHTVFLSPLRLRDKGGIIFFDDNIDDNGKDGN